MEPDHRSGDAGSHITTLVSTVWQRQNRQRQSVSGGRFGAEGLRSDAVCAGSVCREVNKTQIRRNQHETLRGPVCYDGDEGRRIEFEPSRQPAAPCIGQSLQSVLTTR